MCDRPVSLVSTLAGTWSSTQIKLNLTKWRMYGSAVVDGERRLVRSMMDKPHDVLSVFEQSLNYALELKSCIVRNFFKDD